MKYLKLSIALLSSVIIPTTFAQTFAKPIDMAGQWYQPVEIAGATAKALQVKVGDTVQFTMPAGVYVSSAWGTLSLGDCTTKIDAKQSISICKVSALGNYTNKLSFGINAKAEAGTHAKGTLTVSPAVPAQSGELSVMATTSGTVPTVQPHYELFDRTGKLVNRGTLTWQHPFILKNLDSSKDMNPYKLETPKVTTVSQFYVPNQLTQSVTIINKKMTAAHISYTPQPFPKEKVTFTVSSFPAGQHESTITLDDGVAADQQHLKISHNGSYDVSIPQNDKSWALTGSTIADTYYADFDPMTVLANTASAKVNVTYTKAPAHVFFFSPYKDITVNMNWNNFELMTKVNHKSQDLLDALLPQNKMVTFAFTTGQCGAENWGGVKPADLKKNIPEFVKKGIKYVISTGGAAGTFYCNSPEKMQEFVQNYASPSFAGIDFDIEGGYSPQQLQDLMKATAAVQKKMPSLRVSLTLATLSTPDGTLNPLGIEAFKAANAAGLKFNVNLMTMDYGSMGCSVKDMGDCAINAAKYFSQQYHVPLNRIELTPMIGDNDNGPPFTLANAAKVASFIHASGLAGLHYWSFDRDTNCGGTAKGLLGASPACNTKAQAPLEFDHAFINGLAHY